MKSLFRFILASFAFASALALTPALAAHSTPDKAIFTSTLPQEIDGMTDLWVVKFAPTKEEPEGGLYVVPRHVLRRYSEARTRGFLWDWAPLKEVIYFLDDAVRPPPVQSADDALRAENEALKKRIRDAVILLGTGVK